MFDLTDCEAWSPYDLVTDCPEPPRPIEPVEYRSLREAAAHLAALSPHQVVHVHRPAPALLAWAVSQGWHREDYPATEKRPRAFAAWEKEIHGVRVVLFDHDDREEVL